MPKDAERLDGVYVVECLHLETHDLAAHLTHLHIVFALLLDDKLGCENREWGAGECQKGHHCVVVHDDTQCGEKLIDGDDDGGKPTDGVGAHRAYIACEAVQYVAVAVAVDGHPVGIDDLVENVTLDVVVDADLKLQCHAAKHVADYKTEKRTAHHHDHHDPQFCHLVAGDDVDEVFACYARHQAQRAADDAEDDVEQDGALVFPTVGENPAPVVEDFAQRTCTPSVEQGEQRIKR